MLSLLTIQRLQHLSMPILIDRLVLRKLFYYAVKICQYLKIADAEGASRILAHWACYKVQRHSVLVKIRSILQYHAYCIKSIQDFIKWHCTLLYMFRMYYCKTRKYGTIQILAPLAQIPLSAKFNSAPTMFQMYSISSSLKTINSIVYVWHFSQLINSSKTFLNFWIFWLESDFQSLSLVVRIHTCLWV